MTSSSSPAVQRATVVAAPPPPTAAATATEPSLSPSEVNASPQPTTTKETGGATNVLTAAATVAAPAAATTTTAEPEPSEVNPSPPPTTTNETVAAAAAAATTEEPEPSEVNPLPPKRKRGRPKGAKNKNPKGTLKKKKNATVATTTTSVSAKYFIIGKCENLDAPALFLSWKDCQFYLDMEEDDYYEHEEQQQPQASSSPPQQRRRRLDYKGFGTLDHAVTYLKHLRAISTTAATRTTTSTKKSTKRATPSTSTGRINQHQSTSQRDVVVAQSPLPPPAATTNINNNNHTNSDDDDDDNNNINRKRPRLSSSGGDGHVEEEDKYDSDSNTNNNCHEESLPDSEFTQFIIQKQEALRKQKHEKKKRQRHVLKFKRQIELLKQFKLDYGDCDVPMRKGDYVLNDDDPRTIDWNKYSGLGGWVSHIRTHLIRYQKPSTRDTSVLSDEQVQELLDLGFLLEPKRCKKLAPKELWKEDQFQALLQFRTEHGHCDVPLTCPRTPLREWIDKMNKAFKDFQTGVRTEMKEDYITRMVSVGFAFNPTTLVPYEERVKQWLAYKAQHNGDYPVGYTPLAKWITKMRTRYRLFTAGKPSPGLSQAQVDKLTRLGFEWKSRYKTPRIIGSTKNKTFDERFDELLAYKEQYGDTNVPYHYPDKLGVWVHVTRTEVRKFHKGVKPCSMSQERLNRLVEIEFTFETPRNFFATAATIEAAAAEGTPTATKPAAKRGRKPKTSATSGELNSSTGDGGTTTRTLDLASMYQSDSNYGPPRRMEGGDEQELTEQEDNDNNGIEASSVEAEELSPHENDDDDDGDEDDYI